MVWTPLSMRGGRVQGTQSGIWSDTPWHFIVYHVARCEWRISQVCSKQADACGSREGSGHDWRAPNCSRWSLVPGSNNASTSRQARRLLRHSDKDEKLKELESLVSDTVDTIKPHKEDQESKMRSESVIENLQWVLIRSPHFPDLEHVGSYENAASVLKTCEFRIRQKLIDDGVQHFVCWLSKFNVSTASTFSRAVNPSRWDHDSRNLL
jgi:hypothetical protein